VASAGPASQRAIGSGVERLLLCFVLGAVLGTLLDGIHAYGDVLAYPDPDFGRWAWFVPLEFGLLGLAAGLVMPALERAVGADGPIGWPSAAAAGELVLFSALYVLTALANNDLAAPLAIALCALAAVRLLWYAVPGDWAYALSAALLGPAGEAALSAVGAFDYLEPDVAGIPLWLPALWANGGFLIRRLIRPIVMPSGHLDPPGGPTDAPETPRLTPGR
jgi:hypothetical protein